MPSKKVLEVIERQLQVEELFSDQERAIIWAALDHYDCGPEEANPRLYKKLETVRKGLLLLF